MCVVHCTFHCSNHDLVKERIMHKYKLVPEAYRQKLRNRAKQSSSAHVEFACEKESRLTGDCHQIKPISVTHSGS